jgi:metal-responsive CopG/Arc/MetJ family transcriptional regulator
MSDRSNRAGVAIVISLKAPLMRAVRVNITLPADVLDMMDKYADAHGLTRSGFIAQAAKHEMEHAWAPEQHAA